MGKSTTIMPTETTFRDDGASRHDRSQIILPLAPLEDNRHYAVEWFKGCSHDVGTRQPLAVARSIFFTGFKNFSFFFGARIFRYRTVSKEKMIVSVRLGQIMFGSIKFFFSLTANHPGAFFN